MSNVVLRGARRKNGKETVNELLAVVSYLDTIRGLVNVAIKQN